ncbi:SDR family NAD(P)-dependent oxidoreductase [Streptomyces sp. NPDC002143]
MDRYRYPLASRVAVVVGCAGGIGAATAATLAARGAAVLLADIDEAAVKENAARIVEAGGTAAAAACDVRDEGQVAATMKLAVDTFGRLDILHNNAAAMHLLRDDGDVVSTDIGHWDQTMTVNLRGQLLGSKHAIPHMLAGGRGSIVNTASVTGLLGDVMLTAYGASKAAIAHLTQSIATQYGKRGIRCNAVVPGLIRVSRPGGGLSEKTLRNHLRQQLLDVVGQPQDVANAVAFLAGDEAGFITGQLLKVDAGLTAHQPSYADALDAMSSA